MNKLIARLVAYFENLSRISKVSLLVVFVLGFFGLLLQILYPDRPPVVSQISPSIEFGIPENSNFTIAFTQVLNESTKKNLSFKVEPPINANTYWLANSHQYYIETQGSLETNSKYTVSVFYKNKNIFSHTYQTSAFTIEEQREHIREQSQGDIDFNLAIENLKKDFFWYEDIPIDTDQYTIIYDYDEKKFRIRLKTSKNTDAEIIENLTKKALSELESISVDPAEWGYYVLFLD